MSKEIKLHLGLINEDNKLEELPENIKNLLGKIDKSWFDRMKDIDKKMGILLKQLEQYKKDNELIAKSNSGLASMVTKKDHQIKILEKALELACEFNATTTCNAQCKDCLHKDICDNTPKIDFKPIYADYFKTKAKEIMKSDLE